ncbi:glycosyltransferase family 4 protein [Flammeovirga pacifica]|uniref:Glycosyl transferase family 1 domain-containing protein n=1 Tax=Flammeovirga pacifica TaxID=915059 RepID=A0A1S1Z138_FLAPC|nr:glycosyltransferase family 1 protein [Flammeovirga pacifica]OHX66961.1 hypothetical protein NH26_11700 [Flammeovirga pacifica]
MKQKILIDLDKLKIPYCGLGNVSINFGNALFTIEQDQFNWEVLVSDTQSVSHLDTRNYSIQKLSILKKKNIIPFDSDVDLVHITNQMTKYYVSKGKKNILTIHDLNYVFEEKEEVWKKKLQKLQKHVNNATLITTISQFTKDIVKQYLKVPEGLNIKVVSNGVESPYNQPTSKPASITSTNKFFFTIGTVMPKKNFHILVEMMKYTDEEYHLYIAGSPSKEDYVQQISDLIEEHQLTDRVKMIGEVTTEEKNYLYNECNAFLFPSLYEGFGLPIIEAMYCGKPVVCSNLTSLPEVGGESAAYWEDFDPKKMAEVVKNKVAQHYLNQNENEETLKEYASQFNWEKNAMTYFKLYKDLLID